MWPLIALPDRQELPGEQFMLCRATAHELFLPEPKCREILGLAQPRTGRQRFDDNRSEIHQRLNTLFHHALHSSFSADLPRAEYNELRKRLSQLDRSVGKALEELHDRLKGLSHLSFPPPCLDASDAQFIPRFEKWLDDEGRYFRPKGRPSNDFQMQLDIELADVFQYAFGKEPAITFNGPFHRFLDAFMQSGREIIESYKFKSPEVKGQVLGHWPHGNTGIKLRLEKNLLYRKRREIVGCLYQTHHKISLL